MQWCTVDFRQYSGMQLLPICFFKEFPSILEEQGKNSQGWFIHFKQWKGIAEHQNKISVLEEYSQWKYWIHCSFAWPLQVEPYSNNTPKATLRATATNLIICLAWEGELVLTKLQNLHEKKLSVSDLIL